MSETVLLVVIALGCGVLVYEIGWMRGSQSAMEAMAAARGGLPPYPSPKTRAVEERPIRRA